MHLLPENKSDFIGKQFTENAFVKDGGSNAKFILPIFPLYKSVKLPTEELTLNLHEERSIALAEYVFVVRQSNQMSNIASVREHQDHEIFSSDTTK